MTLIASASMLTVSAPMAQAYMPEPDVAHSAAPVAFSDGTATYQAAPSAVPASQPTTTPTRAAQAPATPAPVAKPAPATGITGTAAAYTGIGYVWGGSTPAGFDCSGYTQFVFAANGINIPRTASAQQAAATPVSNPVPGDLVFFGYPAHHVGIYAGNGMMYDSPRPGKATSLRAIWTNDVTFGRF